MMRSMMNRSNPTASKERIQQQFSAEEDIGSILRFFSLTPSPPSRESLPLAVASALCVAPSVGRVPFGGADGTGQSGGVNPEAPPATSPGEENKGKPPVAPQ
jgi:hypothetical protein